MSGHRTHAHDESSPRPARVDESASARPETSRPDTSRLDTSRAAADRPGDGPRKIRVAVVFGGRSSEHAVSCATAASVMHALDRDRYDVVPVGITTDGAWVLEADEPERFALTAANTPKVDAGGSAVVLRTDPTRGELVRLDAANGPASLTDIDIVFPLLHGPFGEDGTLQGLLEMTGLRYVGAGVLASAVAMDKAIAKVVLAGAGLPVGPYTVLRIDGWHADPAGVQAAVAELGYPVFVKPARGGSSLGISKVTEPARLAEALEHAAGYDPKIVVEAAVEGAREIECGVLEGLAGRAPETSPVAEIVLNGDAGFYDFAAKYLATEEQVALNVPADLPPEVAERVQDLAARAFTAIDGEGLSRVDFFLTRDGDLLVNEINTMPGFTPLSMFPRMWAEAGVSYPQLVDRLIATARSRRAGLR